MLWRYRHDLAEDRTFCCGPANRGPALSADKVFSVTIDARLIALDRKTGKVIRDRAITDSGAGKAEQLDPLPGVAELQGAKQTGQTGYTANLVALEADTGKLRWHYQQVPHDRWGYDVASPPVLFDPVEGGEATRSATRY